MARTNKTHYNREIVKMNQNQITLGIHNYYRNTKKLQRMQKILEGIPHTGKIRLEIIEDDNCAVQEDCETGDITIAIGTPLLKNHTDLQLEFIIRHELAHIQLEHQKKDSKLKQKLMLIRAAAFPIITILGLINFNTLWITIPLVVVTEVFRVAIINNNRRNLELEADRHAAVTPELKEAGKKALAVDYENISRLNIFSTHPSTEKRLANLNTI